MNAKRCIVTGNICGTDTVMAGMECPSTSGRCAHKTYIGLSPEYAAGYKAGREAGMREAAALLRRSEDRLIGGIRRVAAADRHTAYVLHNHADAILSAIEGAK